MQLSRLAMGLALIGVQTLPVLAQTAPAPAPAPASASQARPDLQTLFNAATDAWAEDDCAKALPLFAQLAADPRVKPGGIAYAAIAVRRGDCLIATGQAAEGEAMVAQGLPQLRSAGEEFTQEVVRVEQRLGNLAATRWDHDSALAHYRAALSGLKGRQRSQTLMWLAQLTAFDGGNVALDAVNEGYALASAGEKPDRSAQWPWLMMKGRILLNQNRIKEGSAALDQALNLTHHPERLSLEETLLRADLSQAAMLSKNRLKAYAYMAESGAGRLQNSVFTAARMDPPACGPDTGLEPDDRAVVEFRIAADGHVEEAHAVYANGPYAKAAAFARAVQQWAWTEENAAKIPAFFRAATRVEIVCTRADGPGGQSPLGPLNERFMQWVHGLDRTVAVQDGDGNEGGVSRWQPALTAAEAAQKEGREDRELAARVVLARRDLRGDAVRMASIERAMGLARAGSPRIPPEAARAALVLLEEAKPSMLKPGKVINPDYEQLAMDGHMALAEDPVLAPDALAQDTALLVAAPRRPRADQAERARAALLRVAQDQRLPEHHPLRQFAQLRLASDAARAGDLDKAAQWFAATGLNQEQCALIGPRPALTNASSMSSFFPMDALRYGFEGWARAEFDIQADGRTAQIRTVLSYPPFVFSDAAREMMSAARYQASYRPERGAACSASSDSIRFVIPGNTNTVQLVKPKK